jgi:hypothetical protein
VKDINTTSYLFPTSISATNKLRRMVAGRGLVNQPFIGLGLVLLFILQGLVFSPVSFAQKLTPVKQPSVVPNAQGGAGKTFQPTSRPITSFSAVNVRRVAQQEALDPSALNTPGEIRAIQEPRGDRPFHGGVPILNVGTESWVVNPGVPQAPAPSATGTSPIPTKTFKAEFLSATSIPPDTMGAVGTTHIVTVSNDRMRIQTRDGVEISRMTLTSFWAGVAIKGLAVASAFDPKVYFDRFNGRFILISSGNGQNANSGALFAVSQTADPTGLWNRYSVVADPASTAAGGHWIDYPTVGFSKNWIVVNENVFNFGSAGTGYYGQQVYVLDKQAAYNNTLASISLFEAPFTACSASATPQSELGCGFTMAPSINEDNTTNVQYLVEDWDNVAAQLRLSKMSGTAAAPILTVGTQFPQSTNSWASNATRIASSGGYAPQRQQSANLVSGTRIMTNDSRIQNAVYRGGSLWCTHTVMLSTVPLAAGTGTSAANPDNHSGVQWWQIDPTLETGLSTLPIQRARIEDPTANNCYNGAGGTVATAPCNGTTLNQFGQFYAFPNISVNQNNAVLIGFTQFSALSYPSSGYAFRSSSDPINTTRDPVMYRPGQSNYNIGAGSGTARQNRWGDYSAAQTDPIDDTSFWTVQEYAGTNRNDFLNPNYAGPWETWWAQINPANPAPSRSGNLIISEFRLRGPQGVRDEYVELYNPSSTPLIVNTTDNSDGWALASNNGATTTGIAVIPNGTIIPAKGHFLIADNPDNTAGGNSALVYSLNSAPGSQVRSADSDTGFSVDIGDASGIAIFRTSNSANFIAANLMDAAGPSTLPVGSIFREGAGYNALPTTNLEYTMFRNLISGSPQDTNNNAADFVFADTSAAATTAGQRLGVPGPINLGGPTNQTGGIWANSVATCVANTVSPNRVRDFTPVTNGSLGTLAIRRHFTNNIGKSVTKLRFRIIDMTTTPVPALTADLRAISSTSVVVINPCGANVTVQGTKLETPPAQGIGGGLNSTLAAGTVTLSAPLAPAATIDLQFLLGVNVGGNFRFYIIVEAN